MFGPEWGEPSSHKPVARPALLLLLPVLPTDQLLPHALALPAAQAQTHHGDSCPCRHGTQMYAEHASCSGHKGSQGPNCDNSRAEAQDKPSSGSPVRTDRGGGQWSRHHWVPRSGPRLIWSQRERTGWGRRDRRRLRFRSKGVNLCPQETQRWERAPEEEPRVGEVGPGRQACAVSSPGFSGPRGEHPAPSALRTVPAPRTAAAD